VQRFQSFWFGENVSQYQRLAMKSFVDFGHRYILYAYRKFNVPAGVELRDAAELLPEARVFFYGDRAGVGRGSVSGFSNLFRYHLLHRLGGWWVDADVVCLSETVPAQEIFMGWEYEDLIGTAILKFPEGHEFVTALRDAAEEAGTDLGWSETGPSLLTRLAREHDLLTLAVPQAQSYPVQSTHALHLFIPAQREATREKINGKPFLHLWNEVLRRAVVSGWMAPPPDSLMADLFARHRIGFDNAPAYTADQMQRLNDNYLAHTYSEWDTKRPEVRQARRAAEQLTQLEEQSARLEEKLQAAQTQRAAGQAELTGMQAELTGVRADLHVARARADGLIGEIAHLRRQIDALRRSTSWRVTAPMRRLASILRSGARRARPAGDSKFQD
jgi:hypothetical protein